jgi:hypothetical protein
MEIRTKTRSLPSTRRGTQCLLPSNTTGPTALCWQVWSNTYVSIWTHGALQFITISICRFNYLGSCSPNRWAAMCSSILLLVPKIHPLEVWHKLTRSSLWVGISSLFSLKICPSKRSRESSFVRERTQDQCYLSNSECLLAVKYSDVFFLILPNIVFLLTQLFVIWWASLYVSQFAHLSQLSCHCHSWMH